MRGSARARSGQTLPFPSKSGSHASQPSEVRVKLVVLRPRRRYDRGARQKELECGVRASNERGPAIATKRENLGESKTSKRTTKSEREKCQPFDCAQDRKDAGGTIALPYLTEETVTFCGWPGLI